MSEAKLTNAAANDPDMEDFAAMVDQYTAIPQKGHRIEGTVATINHDGAYLDLNCKQTGYIPSGRISPSDDIAVGDVLQLTVTNVDGEEGYVYCEICRDEAWNALADAFENKKSVECTVIRQNPGGLEAETDGIRMFIPASKTGIPKGGDLAPLVKQTVQARIIEFDRAKKHVLGSIRDHQRAMRHESEAKVWETIAIGAHFEGTVRNVTRYGAFVDIGGIDGMVHVSELSWQHVKKPDDVVSPGDKLDVYVLGFDKDTRKISLTAKDPSNNPWNAVKAKYKPGDVLTATVRRLTDFGAFAEVMPGIDGLIHVSQIANYHVDYPSDVLSEGQSVRVKIISMTDENHKIALSMRDADQD